ncbi:hypothetical protein KCTC52924_03620 [Arenibacter antarcticus]
MAQHKINFIFSINEIQNNSDMPFVVIVSTLNLTSKMLYLCCTQQKTQKINLLGSLCLLVARTRVELVTSGL